MWQSVDIPNIGLLAKVNETMCRGQSEGAVRFPDLRATDRLLIVSDYAVERKRVERKRCQERKRCRNEKGVRNQ